MVQTVQVTAICPDSYSSVGDSQRFERTYCLISKVERRQ